MGGPAEFLEGLEIGTKNLARGLFVGVVRGAANVTEVVNSNLADLTADEEYIDERKAHQRLLIDAISRGDAVRSIDESLHFACGSITRGLKSGAMGIFEQPAHYASKHGPVGFVKGVGIALVGAVVKPVVGVGDAVVTVMNHVYDATKEKQNIFKVPKRLRRALRVSVDKPHRVLLVPYDERSSQAQKIVTGGEILNDVYLGHVLTQKHLIIISDQCFWAIDLTTREPWCISWEEISHFTMENETIRIAAFSELGLKSFIFRINASGAGSKELFQLLSMQLKKMVNITSNFAELDNIVDYVNKLSITGIKAKQVNYVFGSNNVTKKYPDLCVRDALELIEKCFDHVKELGSNSTQFFKSIDNEAWKLVDMWIQIHGLSSRRCVVLGIINATGGNLQIKSSKLIEGGSPCYSMPTREFDHVENVLHAGGAIIFFGWGIEPSLTRTGGVFMNIETNAFVGNFLDFKSNLTSITSKVGFDVGFLEKSYDSSGWWAKFWLIVRKV